MSKRKLHIPTNSDPLDNKSKFINPSSSPRKAMKLISGASITTPFDAVASESHNTNTRSVGADPILPYDNIMPVSIKNEPEDIGLDTIPPAAVITPVSIKAEPQETQLDTPPTSQRLISMPHNINSGETRAYKTNPDESVAPVPCEIKYEDTGAETVSPCSETSSSSSTPIATTDPTTFQYDPRHTNPASLCHSCHSRHEVYTTSSDDGNINGGRLYRICPKCDQSWKGFTDNRGIYAQPGLFNEDCDCVDANPVRLVAIKKKDEKGRRGAFYSCQLKVCGFWQRYGDEQGFAKLLSDDEVDKMVLLGQI